jgi:glycosyltransferase involved in cell wall biosynthesis
MSPTATAPQPHILLVGNYLPDGQRSMHRFSHLLQDGLCQRGLQVSTFYPPVIFGKLGAKTHGWGKWIGYLDKYLLAPYFLRRAIHRLPQPRIAHICDHSNAIYTRVLEKEKHLVTCHDLLAVRSALGEIPQNTLRASGKQQQAMILRGLKRSQWIANVSGATRDDVLRIVGHRTQWETIIPNALDTDFIQAAHTPRPQLQTSLPNPLKCAAGKEIYVHIGGEKWYKNRAALLRLFAAIAKTKPQAELAIVGNTFSEKQLCDNHCAHLTDRIHYLSGISDTELRGLYAHAKALLFPSWIEGFGWPILEAQACGCPVATLDQAPMNELNAKQALCLTNNCDSATWADQAARQIAAAIEVDPQALQTFAAAYTNEASIDAYLALYQKILAGGTDIA